MRETYLTCRLPWSLESVERTDENQKLSSNTVAFIRLAITLAGAAKRYDKKGKGGGGSRV